MEIGNTYPCGDSQVNTSSAAIYPADEVDDGGCIGNVIVWEAGK